MPKTPGQVAYEKYVSDFEKKNAFTCRPWSDIRPVFQARWERAAKKQANVLRFECSGKKILMDGEPIAHANSNTLARRIRNALRIYQPNDRGY